MRASDIDLALHPDGHTMQHAALRGQASVRLTSATGQKTIGAPSIDVSLAPDGQTVTRLDGSGGVVVQLPPTADTPTTRTITAPTLAATGDDKVGLKTALFAGSAKFVEHGVAAAAAPSRSGGRAGTPEARAIDRTATAKSLALKLNGDLGAVDSAEFRQAFHFIDGDITADADHAVYAEAQNRLDLDGVDSKVVNGDVTVYAGTINVATDTHDVTAATKVQTITKPQAPAAGKSASQGLFDSSQPTYGSGAHLAYVEDGGRATYQGSDTEQARVWQTQGQNDVRGDTIVAEQAKNNLRSTGHVKTVFTTDAQTGAQHGTKPAGSSSTSSTSSSSTYHAKAQEFSYTDADRTAHYVGASDPAELTSSDGTTTAHTIDVVLAQASRTVDRMVADSDVHLTSDNGREGRGGHLTYTATTDDYHLTGVPALAVLPQSKADGGSGQCMLYSGKELTFAGNGYAAASAGADRVTSTAWTCGKPIK
jgi:lipopolysaccharide export system protein LptA